MLPSHDWAFLTDPVCGRTVEATSPHRIIHGGALFAFCSPACQSQFVELPSRYVVIATAGLVRPAGEPAPLPSRAPAAAPATQAAPKAAPSPAREPPTQTPHAPATMPTPATMSTAKPAPLTPLPGLPAASGEQGPFTWLLAWRERRFAASCARDLLALHRQLSSRYPELSGPSLYRRVVAARLNDDDLAAEAVLQHAEQSFAIWPVERALNFRDIVHYLAVSQFVASHQGARWVYADMKRIVDSVIPAQL